MLRIGIIGGGLIGSEVYKQAKAIGWEVVFVVKKDGVYQDLVKKIDEPQNYKKYCQNIDIAFLAIPTVDDGTTAYEYLTFLLANTIPVVTSEKGTLSNYYAELEQWKDRIGYSATVGGGTRMLKFIEERVGSQTQEVHAIVNGTLNYVFTELSQGKNLEEVAASAQALGYAEPGATSPYEVITKEAQGDIPMKVAILFNTCNFTPKRLRAQEINATNISEIDFQKLMAEASKRRYIVSISTTKEARRIDSIGGFVHEVNGWTVQGGFVDVNANPSFKDLLTDGVNNAVLICDKIGKELNAYRLSGPGAGAVPTASAMIKDAVELVE